MNFGSTSRLGLSLYETSDPLEQWPGRSDGDTEVIIRAVYRQVLGNVHVMDSERLVAPESRLKNGELSVREFVRAVGKSSLYTDRYCDCSRFRQIELAYKHFLGRAPNSYDDMLACTAAMDEGGFDGLIDFLVDSEEFKSVFGNETVPYLRGYKTEALSSTAGFSYMFDLLGGTASSDLGKSSVLNATIAKEQPKAVAISYKPPVILPYTAPATTAAPPAAIPTVPTPSAPTVAGAPGKFTAVTTQPSTDIAVSASSRLGYAPYADSTPLEVWPGQSEGDKEVAIRAAYKQVLGNIHIMDSERLQVPESQYKRGELSLREFVRAIGKSDLYQSRFGDCPRFRKIELGYKHFLGRAPNDYSEMLACTSILDSGSFGDLVDFFVDSDEFQTVFGQDTVPYIRGYATETGQTAATFPYTLQLLTGPASSDYAKASSLNASIIKAQPELPISRYPVTAAARRPAAVAVPGKVPAAQGGAAAPLFSESSGIGGFFGKIFSFVERFTGGGETTAPQEPAAVAPEQPKEAFFLEPDQASSLGNVEYMRAPRTIRRSFPNVAEPEKKLEFEAVVTATKKVIAPEKEKPTGLPSALAPKKAEVKIPIFPASPAPTVTVSSSLMEFGNTAARAGKSGPYVSMSMSPEVDTRRKKDSSLDPFRKMATSIRRGD